MQMKKTEEIGEFVSLFMAGIESWINAGRIVAANLDADPTWAEEVHRLHPEISEDIVYAFDKIGRQELHPKLMLSDCAGAKRLRRLSYKVQEKYVNESVPVLIRSGSGVDTLQVSVFNLTPDQSRQVFDDTGVRSAAAQRAWIEDKSSIVAIQVDEPYRLVGRNLVVMQPCKLTAKQLASLLAQMQ
jgi:hypothetical protein